MHNIGPWTLTIDIVNCEQFKFNPIRTVIIISYFTILMTTALMNHPNEDNKTYSVKRIQDELLVTGKGDSPMWKNAVELTDFIYPWNKENPPATSFRAIHSKDWIYFVYHVKDNSVNVFVDKKDKTDVLNSDRVEIFFKHEDNQLPYYGLEMDPLARVYDYKANFLRKFEPAWTWPEGQLIIKTSRTNEGYIVEIAISKASLLQLGLLKNKTLQAGLYRGNCVNLVGNQATFKWISWVKPDSATPDFHVPSSFGILLLED